jgi:hypothetical protein
MRLVQAGLRPALAAAPEWLALCANAGVEEALRLALALAAAGAIRRLRLEPGVASLGVLASSVLAALENASYLAAFPTADAYWRLGYAVPIHAGAAALYALAAAPSMASAAKAPAGRLANDSPDRRARRLTAAFAVAWAWHAAFNLVAALAPFRALPAVGSALNLVMLAALVVASAIRFGYWRLYATR